MLEKASNVLAAKKYVEYDHEVDAQHQIEAATIQEKLAAEMISNVHDEIGIEQLEVDMIESYDEDIERVRDLSNIHSSKKLEDDAKRVVEEAHHTIHVAKGSIIDSEGMIHRLEEDEANLKAFLNEVRKIRGKKLASSDD